MPTARRRNNAFGRVQSCNPLGGIPMFANRLRVTTAALAVTLAGAGLAATVGVTGVTLAGNISWDSAPTGADCTPTRGTAR